MVCCCCLKTKAKVDNDNDNGCEPLMSEKEKATDEVSSDDNSSQDSVHPSQPGHLAKTQTIGDIEIYDSFKSLSEVDGRIPDNLERKLQSVGNIEIDDLLNKQSSLSRIVGNVPELNKKSADKNRKVSFQDDITDTS